jgi:hypothetical protein
MANFSKVLGLASTAIVFAGMAYGQGTCTAGSVSTNIIRAEGTTEQIAPITIDCGAGGVAGTLSLQVFLSPSLPITSKVLDSTSGKTEAIASIAGGGVAYGTVSGSTLNFSGLSAPAGAFTVTVSNVRVNASSVSVGSGVPPNVSATAFVSGSAGSITPAALSFNNIAFVQNALAAAKVFKSFSSSTSSVLTGVNPGSSGAKNFVICNAYSQSSDKYSGTTATTTTPNSLAFIVQVNENFASAFKTNANEASKVPLAAGAVVTGSAANTVNSGTRVKVVFANVPANVTLYVPTGVLTSANSSGAQLQMTTTETGAFTAATNATSSSVNGNAEAAVSVTSGTGTAVFEVTTDDPNNLDQFNIPVFVTTTANSVAGSSTAITATVSLAPIGSTNIPNFVSTSSTTTLTGSAFNLCSTSLLFPFVTNQLGFDTGLAISNTSTDPFGTSGATAQAGACTLNFYGAGAPSPANVVSPNVPSGTVYTTVLSSVAAGFQGYIIAQCGFQFAHGFAFITTGLGTSSAVAEGYLAGVIPDTNQVTRSANPGAIAGAGTGEVLGN